jgi:hypothetical protein
MDQSEIAKILARKTNARSNAEKAGQLSAMVLDLAQEAARPDSQATRATTVDRLRELIEGSQELSLLSSAKAGAPCSICGWLFSNQQIISGNGLAVARHELTSWRRYSGA